MKHVYILLSVLVIAGLATFGLSLIDQRNYTFPDSRFENGMSQFALYNAISAFHKLTPDKTLTEIAVKQASEMNGLNPTGWEKYTGPAPFHWVAEIFNLSTSTPEELATQLAHTQAVDGTYITDKKYDHIGIAVRKIDTPMKDLTGHYLTGNLTIILLGGEKQ